MITNEKIEFQVNLVEQGLLEIWSLALNHNQIKNSDDFFKIGGDSLLALVVIEQIKQRLGWEISLGDFLRYPTINELIKNRSQQKLTRTDRPIIKMSKHGRKSPCLFIHPTSGLVYAYSKLVRHLSEDRACYALQSPILVGIKVPNTIEEIAEMYSEIIYDEFGDDEFNLLGWSSGGILCFEIAKLSLKKGLNLQKMILLDSYMPSGYHSKLNDDEIISEFYTVFLSLKNPDIEYKINATLNDKEDIFFKISQIIFGCNSEKSEKYGFDFITRLFESYKNSMMALSVYEPVPANVSSMLIHSKENNTVNIWENCIQNKLIKEVMDCNHYALLDEKNSSYMAAKIQQYFNI